MAIIQDNKGCKMFLRNPCVVACDTDADLSSDSPSVALDALYAVLATGLAWNAWQERIALPGNNKDKQ